MSKKLSPEDLKRLVDSSLNELTEFTTELQTNEKNNSNLKRAMLLAYWIKDYVNLLRAEKNFDPTRMLRYKRGDIISVNFGFRIGSELGGRHFAIVLDNHNSQKSPIITVAPLTSLKEKYKDSCFTYLLKKGLYELQEEKFKNLVASCNQTLAELSIYTNKDVISEEDMEIFTKKVASVNRKIEEARILKNELLKLKTGSIIEIGQITTISKLRILNPKFPSDTLNKIRVAPDDLDEINKKIEYLYLYNLKKENLISPFIEGLNQK